MRSAMRPGKQCSSVEDANNPNFLLPGCWRIELLLTKHQVAPIVITRQEKDCSLPLPEGLPVLESKLNVRARTSTHLSYRTRRTI